MKWLLLLFLLFFAPAAFAQCPTVISACPSPTYNAPTIGGLAVFNGVVNLNAQANIDAQLNFNPVTVISNSYNPPFREILTYTGGSSSHQVMNYFFSTDNVAQTSALGTDMEVISVQQLFGGALMTGARNAFVVVSSLTASSGNALASGGTQFSNIQGYTDIKVNDGGLDLTTLGHQAGVSWNLNTVATLETGATDIVGTVGWEADFLWKTGSSGAGKIGVECVLLPGDVVQGYGTDTCLMVQGGPSNQWKNAIQFGGIQSSSFATNASGTLINAIQNAYTPYTMAALNGIDFHLVTFSGNSWNDGHISMSGAGLLTAAPTTASFTMVTNEATAGSGYFIPFANPSTVSVGSGVSGTNIPSGDTVLYVSGGTTTVTTTTGFAIPQNSNYLPVNNAAGIITGMLATDTTTAGAINATATSGGTLSPTALTPVTLTSPTAGSGAETITVTSGGASCVPGMVVYDVTTPSSTTNPSFVVTSSAATSITVSLNLNGPIVNTDTVKCFPVIAMGIQSMNQAGGVPAGDTVVFSPSIALYASTTGVIASGATITFTNPVAVMSAPGGLAVNTLNLATGGSVTWNGLPVIQFANGVTYQNNPGGDILIGIGAGAVLGAGDSLTTAVGYQALNRLITENSESTAVGYHAGANARQGGYLNLFGINALGSCQYNCSQVTAFGTDTFRNSLLVSASVAVGSTTGLNYNGYGLTAVGVGLMQGPNGGAFTGQWITAVGYGMNGASATTASDLAFFGTFIGNGITTADNDTCVGDYACQSITSDGWNAAFGVKALNALTGNGNTGDTALGMQAAQKLTGGSWGTYVGFSSGGNFTTGSYNTVLGEQVATSVCTTASHEILIGVDSNTTCGAAGESYTFHLGIAAADLILITGANVPSTSIMTIAGIEKFANAFVANGAVATTMTSLGPTGSHATIQEWLQVIDAAGTTRYVPAY